MIVLSVGMPRAGSAWHYNLIHDLMAVNGARDAREIRTRFHLESILSDPNCNIGVLSLRRLAMVSVPLIAGKSFVIKAHSGPTAWSRLLERLGGMRITYIYRDPRDAMLSAFDYGRRALQKGRPNAFSHLSDFDASLNFMLDYVAIWEQWMQEPRVLKVRYEDLLTHYEVEAARLADFLHVDASAGASSAAIEKYRPAQASSNEKGIHFFKGQIGRYREAYTPEQQKVLAARFGRCLQRMGYAI